MSRASAKAASLPQHPNNLKWTHYAANSLPLLQRVRFARHLRQCGPCRERAAALRQEREAYQQSDAYAQGLAALQARLGPRRAPRRAWPWLGGLAAVGCAALLGVAVLPQGQQLIDGMPPQAQGLLRAKGGEQFVLLVERNGEVAPLGPQCQGGDRLRARYRSDRGHLLVVELDGTGQAQVVFPAHGSASATIGDQVDLTPGSWVLDDTPGRERFVAVFSRAPLPARQVLQAVRSGTVLSEPGVYSVEVACTKAQP